MNRRSILSVTAFLAVTAVAPTLYAQTVTVAKTGGTFSTVQAALDSFVGDSNPAPNVVQITDNGVYEEMVTVKSPVSLVGTGSSRPTLALIGNPVGTGTDSALQNHGLVVNVPTLTTSTVELKNLILIPSKTTPPTFQAVRTVGVNLFFHVDNVLITANNGSDAPVTVDGLTAVDLSAATQFGDDGMFLGSAAGGGVTGDGFEALITNTVITHNRTGVAAEGIVVSNTAVPPRKLKLGDGCVISFNGRHGIQASQDIIIDAPTKPVLLLGNVRGIWMPGDSPNTRYINGLRSINNTSYGILMDNAGGVTAKCTLKNSIIAGNGENGVHIATSIAGGADILACTLQGKSTKAPLSITAAATGPVLVRNTILAGDAGQNSFNYSGTGGLTLDSAATITNGSFALSQATSSGNGTVTGTAVTNSDPEFVETVDFNNPSYFNVASSAYGNISTTGGGLGGGAKYVGTSGVNDWTVY